ncbi:DEAD/DEAH box helicase [Agrococcus carbonis]|uniref:ATP dependent helicase, Lhr family n=1 Tax=Agrococcus carbonis TaxID=684552 RepID=A0A1H1N6J3_9MICO|nr:DEAD/DEAH box helicase [Agrococcus carbonis]SDR94622.1 ATP dependent helicase, Lhr family [Agrococcus carbonis]
MGDALELFSPATRAWFAGAFDAPTPAQEQAWASIARGDHTLVVAPTGSGKTLAAFLWAIDRLHREDAEPHEEREPGVRVLYVSPLKALAVDVDRNLRAPLAGIAARARAEGAEPPPIRIGLRTGDTPQEERRQQAKHPPDILITTPESLFLLLTSRARETLRTVETVIVDEVHAVVPTKRGAHLAVSLERLDALLPEPAQRIGLSATVNPIEEVAAFLGGPAPVTTVAPPSDKRIELTITVPVDDMTDLRGPAREESAPTGSAFGSTQPETPSIWPHIEREVLELVDRHRSTIVFVNARRAAERLTARLNELDAERLDALEAADAEGDGGSRDASASGARSSTGGSSGTRSSTGGSSGTRSSTSGGGNGGARDGVVLRDVSEHIRLRLAERAAARETGGDDAEAPPLARAHHGSVSKEQRAEIEDQLKSGRLRCVVATSSLELGIDMGEVDLVVQVESPPSTASGLQRVGRAGHNVGDASRGVLIPKHRADLLHATVVADRMARGQLEPIRMPRHPLDVLAQHTVAAAAMDVLDVDEWFQCVRRAAGFATLPRSAYDATLDLVSGVYPSDEFAELRPRVVWDREAGTIEGRPSAQRVAVSSGGTIPDRGLFGVFLAGQEGKPGARVGELDEEMVYESRAGDVFALGATSWRVVDITHDRVLVVPAFGEPGKLPFWHGDAEGRPADLGRSIGQATAALAAGTGIDLPHSDERAIRNLDAYVRDQLAATGAVPTDAQLVVERSRDELGDWRLIVHSPWGRRVHAPWALAIDRRLREDRDLGAAAMASDDGIVIRIPDSDAEPPGAELIRFEPDELVSIVETEAGGTALFASRFRECAARALLLPKRDPARRAPLWQQRQRAAQLLDVAKRYPDFPIVLEALREVLQDAYDLPALRSIAERLQHGDIRVVEVETPSPSPFAHHLLFGYVGAFLYEGDAPLAERRAAALTLDPALLADVLGQAALRELLDPAVVERTELELQRLAPDRRAKGVEGAADLLRLLGPLTVGELALRLEGDADGHLDESGAAAIAATLVDARRAVRVRIGDEERVAAIEDVARLRDALGVPPPQGVPSAFLEAVADPIGDVVARHARTHGPFTLEEAAAQLGLPRAVAHSALRALERQGRVVPGEYRQHGTGEEWIDAQVLSRLKRRSLQALRSDVEPVDHAVFADHLLAHQRITRPLSGTDGVLEALDRLDGVPLPLSALETLILPSRVRDYRPSMLDELTASGVITWVGAGALGGRDGRVVLRPADTVEQRRDTEHEDPDAQALLEALSGGGALFAKQLSDILAFDLTKLGEVLWPLVWAGRVTNDTIAPLRAHLLGVRARSAPAPSRRAAPVSRRRLAGAKPFRSDALPTLAGRWLLASAPTGSPTERAAQTADALLARYGVVTRGSVVAEDVPGGFHGVYQVLKAFEEAGHTRRGYFVDGLGAAQFADAPVVDALRARQSSGPSDAVATVAAVDPANPFGASLPWPEARAERRPTRRVGALTTIASGRAVLHLERGGKALLTFTDDEPTLVRALESLADAVARLGGRRRVIEEVDGRSSLDGEVAALLEAGGLRRTPRGFRIGP